MSAAAATVAVAEDNVSTEVNDSSHTGGSPKPPFSADASSPPPALVMPGKGHGRDEEEMMPAEPVHANKRLAGEQTVDNRCVGATILDYLLCFNVCMILPERTNLVELYFGRYIGTVTRPGCYCRNACFVELRRISTALQTINLPNVKVIDARGSPLIVSGTVTFEVVDARRATIEVTDAFKYVKDLAPRVLKRVVSRFPYESSSNAPGEPSLRTETESVGKYMREAHQKRCSVAGVRIESFSIDELSYAPEIAQAMLKRQQAEALVDARRAIVTGAQEIASKTTETVGSDMSQEERVSLLANLLVVLVSDQDVVPTVSLGT